VRNTENLAHGRAVEEYKVRYQHGEHLLQPGGLVPADKSNTVTRLIQDPDTGESTCPWHTQGSTMLMNATECVWKVGRKTYPVSVALDNSRQIKYLQKVIVPLVHLAPLLDSKRPHTKWLELKTEVQHEGGTIVRSHPHFNSDGPWYDWINVAWDSCETEPIPAHVRLLFVVSQWKRSPNKHNGLDLSVDDI